MNRSHRTFIRNIRNRLEMHDITQRDFARQINYHHVTVCRILTGHFNPSLGFQDACSKFFKEPLWQLMKPE